MARFKMEAGATFDVPSLGEHQDLLERTLRSWEYEKLKGIKVLNLPQLQGTASGGTLKLGYGSVPVGPKAGYIWSVSRLVVAGLATGTTPDIVNFYVNHDSAAVPLWQLNGNSFGETFGKLQMVLFGGDFLLCTGTITSTSTITVGGTVIEIPAEMVGKLA